MRLTYTLAVAVVATLHASSTAFPTVQDSTAANGAVAAIVDSSVAKGSRMLRVDYSNAALDADNLDDDYVEKEKTGYGHDAIDVNNVDDDYVGEERGFGDVVKKLNPIAAAKKSAEKAAEQSAKVKKTLQDAGDYQKMIEKARAMANMD